ncbi:PREDICTED: nucleolar protein 12-like [Priapulus caudatus]|uniref:Nucleolar protein 12 n=1 Tax=Priapulus caudatus TaxID=37621 RepID=A0ABM1EHG5_PRICU|nr:PREDICTED: nucleolar protein 12-like [Priapulus caudatus]
MAASFSGSYPKKVPHRKRKNKQNKVVLDFDIEGRKDYLLGFKKRKDERRKKAQEEIEKNFKEAKKKAKQDARASMMKNIKQDIAKMKERNNDLLEPLTYEHPEQTVTVTTVEALDTDTGGLVIGHNSVSYEEEDSGGKHNEECKDASVPDDNTAGETKKKKDLRTQPGNKKMRIGKKKITYQQSLKLKKKRKHMEKTQLKPGERRKLLIAHGRRHK